MKIIACDTHVSIDKDRLSLERIREICQSACSAPTEDLPFKIIDYELMLIPPGDNVKKS
jgi:hypothetical protein